MSVRMLVVIIIIIIIIIIMNIYEVRKSKKVLLALYM